MSISSALSNALSGLSANARIAQVISANVANAQTPGYAPRAIALATRGQGHAGGVMVLGVVRHVDAGLLADRRVADGALAGAGVRAGFLADLEALIGTPDRPDSLSARLAAFEAGLVTAAARPEEEARLQAAVGQAGDLARALNAASNAVQQARSDAEAGIVGAVDAINAHLREVGALNARIIDATNAGHPTAAFQDQRRLLLDQIAELVPIRLAQRDGGAVALYTQGGVALLDGRAAELSFTAANVITPGMTVANGALGQLSINGRPVAAGGPDDQIGDGRLSGLFDLRDSLATDAQAQLDAVARDLISRFQDPAVDLSRGPGGAGLFTDAGAAFDPADESGIAQRLTLNQAVDPGSGGALWRLRDGLGATVPGDAGDAGLLQDLSAAMARSAPLASGDLGVSARDFPGHLGTLVSRFGQDRLALDQTVAFATAQRAGLVEAELAMGVDTDAEMQHLMMVEKAYSANARVIEVVDRLIDSLLGI